MREPTYPLPCDVDGECPQHKQAKAVRTPRKSNWIRVTAGDSRKGPTSHRKNRRGV